MSQSSPWLFCHSPRPQARLRLFCFPFAGGSASAYRLWQEGLPETIEVCPVQLPGRENRLGEPPETSVPALMEQVMDGLAPFLDRPFVLLGHSMGAMIAYRMACELARRGAAGPEALVILAATPPHLPRAKRRPWELSDEALIAQIQEFNGIPQLLLDEPELLALFMPMLRADFTLVDAYEHVPCPPLSLPLALFAGAADEHAPPENVARWGELTTGEAPVQVIEGGGHFFPASHRNQLLGLLNRALAPFTS